MSTRIAQFILHLPAEDLIQRAHLLAQMTRVILLIAVFGGVLLLSGVLDLQDADRIAAILILLTLVPTGACAFASRRHAAFQVSAFCFIVGLALAISLAVWQFGRRVPEVHLGYFIPIAIAAILGGSRLGFVAALIVWGVNVWIVANQPESRGVYSRPHEIIGLLTLGASYVADAFVVGRFAENLAHAVSRIEEKAEQAAQAEKKAVETTHRLEIALRSEQFHRQQLATLYALASRLAATSKLEDLLPFTTESLRETLQVSFAAMLLIEKDEVLVASCNPCRDSESPLEIGRGAQLSQLPIIRRALAQRQCETIHSHEHATLAESEAEFLNSARVSSLAIVPVHLADKPLGAFILGEARAWERAPLDAEKLQLAQSVADLTAGAIQRSRLFDELEEAYVQTVLALAKAVEAKDTYTADHAERLADQAEQVARKLGVNDPEELRALRFGARLHDVGKIGVPDSILNKPGPLDADEWQLMRQHPAIGSRILEPIARLKDAAHIVRHHHERWDGKGYPDGLRGDAIPLGARILTVVDSYSAITDARVYKTARSHSEAIAELHRGAGAQFDPRVVDALLEMLETEIPRTIQVEILQPTSVVTITF